MMKTTEIHARTILSPSQIYDYVIIDRMNYHHADWIYAKYGWGDKRTDDYFRTAGSRIAAECANRGIDCRLAY